MYASALAAALPGPDWLRRHRVESAERAAAAALPTTEAEEWRYSPIDDLVLDRFAPALEAPRPDAAMAAGPFAAGAAALVTTADGHLMGCVAHDARLQVGSAVGLDEPVAFAGSTDVFADANSAFAPDPVVIRIPAGVLVETPIVVDHQVVRDGAATFPQLLVAVGADADVSIIEVVRSTDVSGLCVPVTRFVVGDAARVRYQQIQILGDRLWQIGMLDVEVGAQATFEGGLAAMGGSYARLRTDCRLTGRGATGNLSAIYFGDHDQTLDFRTFQHHIGRDTQSNLLFKGVVDDEATSIYTGLIRVGKEAAGTVAFQTNRTIKLSTEAWAESVPNLEIENNDVRCSHASTVSPVDPEQRFYLESRGVPTTVAERLIVEGFLADVIAQLPVPEVRDFLVTQVHDKLDERTQQ